MEELIELLRDGNFHSGEELGQALGISRAAVWKKIQAITALGLPLDTLRGKGYRLLPGIELLDKHRIEQYLMLDAQAKTMLVLKLSTLSTNDAVREAVEQLKANEQMEAIEKKDSEGKTIHVCIAEHQSAGRGRRGRSWVSPFGASLCYSMLCRHEGGFAAMEGLSLAVGLTVLQTLEVMGVTGISLKWPNDLVVCTASGKLEKLAGVLLEVSGDPTGVCEIVIGIGINLMLPEAQKAQIDQPVTDVYTLLGHTINKNELAGRLTSNLVVMLKIFQQEGFRVFREDWQRYDAFADQPVALFAGDRQIVGVANGVSENGAVLIKNDNGVTTAHAGGEISLRKL